MSAYAIDRRLPHGGLISKSGEPFHTGLFAKPGDLALGVVSGISLRFVERLIGRHLAAQHLQDLAVAVGLEGFRRCGPAHIENPLHFLHQAA
jgi:hypothetical protein